jgi:membrane-bound serine protease (ClpP class)
MLPPSLGGDPGRALPLTVGPPARPGQVVPRYAISSLLPRRRGCSARVAGRRAGAQSGPATEVTGTIDPATAGWMSSALEDAQGAPLAIVRIDTPGGRDTSMREIVQDIIAALMPVPPELIRSPSAMEP